MSGDVFTLLSVKFKLTSFGMKGKHALFSEASKQVLAFRPLAGFLVGLCLLDWLFALLQYKMLSEGP